MTRLKVGTEVLVRTAQAAPQRGWVLNATETEFVWGANSNPLLARHTGTRLRADEGVTWVRGWSGQTADAFRGALALLAD